jgi:formylglycine-generating enzyme required for sulfatase activity
MTFNGTIYNMSGNAEEWTAPRAVGVNPVRGGSYNDAQGGMTCGFNFEVAADTIALPNVGFRCCRTTAP